MSKAKNPYVREPHSIPDWLVEMKIGGRKSIVAMEVELNYKGKRRMQKVFDMYARKESINHIWYIVPTKSFGEKILRSAISLIKSHGKYKVFFSIISEVKDDPYNLKFYFSNEEVITQKLNVENAHSTTHCVSKTEVAA